MSEYRKKLIEVAMPLEAINVASAREKSIRHGHPSTLHLWWARRPLAACRAVLFGQLVDDPSSHPDRFPTEADQKSGRDRLFRIIEDLVLWENTNNEQVVNAAQAEIARSLAWSRDEEPPESPDAVRAYLAEYAPPVLDPFSGGGSIPLEAQRLGMQAHGSDLNPVAVLIGKALIEFPPKFAGMAPVNPKARKNKKLLSKDWQGAAGLAEDVRYYGEWMREKAKEKIGHLYPPVEITQEMLDQREDLRSAGYEAGEKLTVIAWLWARTVPSPNPAMQGVHVPLVRSFELSKKKGKEAWVEPIVDKEAKTYRFEVKSGKRKAGTTSELGTRAGKKATFLCLLSGDAIETPYIRSTGKDGGIKERMMAIVCEGHKGRIYFSPSDQHLATAMSAQSKWKPEQEIADNPRYMSPPLYGFTTFGDLFTQRQLVALTTFSDLVTKARDEALKAAQASGQFPDDARGLEEGGSGAIAYADAIATYLAFAVDRGADAWSTIVSWRNGVEATRGTFARQALPMVWDFAEANPFSGSCGNWTGACLEWIRKSLMGVPLAGSGAVIRCEAAQALQHVGRPLLSTDPPYYDNIGYADLSDFFYVWLKRSIGESRFPAIFSTLLAPKAEELVATSYRHGTKAKAERFFLEGMEEVMRSLADGCSDYGPAAIYYAFKQSETKGDKGTSSTGWETFLEAVVRSGFSVLGTWPVRTERSARTVGIGTNALASSVVLVCRKRPADAPTTTKAAFLRELSRDLPTALRKLQESNIAPVDLPQACIGPGMAIYSKYATVLEADGSAMAVREALIQINQAIDEYFSEAEGSYDPHTRFAISWFEQFGFEEGPFGDADNIARSRNVSVAGVQEAGVIHSAAGKVRVLKRDELEAGWTPQGDKTFTIWEGVQYLIRALEQGETTAARILAGIEPNQREAVRELCYRLYQVCERKKWAAEARAYNTLITSWREIEHIAPSVTPPKQGELDFGA